MRVRAIVVDLDLRVARGIHFQQICKLMATHAQTWLQERTHCLKRCLAREREGSHQQCDVNYREIRRVNGIHYRMVLHIS